MSGLKKTFMVLGSVIFGVAAGSITVFKFMKESVTYREKKYKKFKSYYETLNQWLILKDSGQPLEDYFVTNDYKTVAIYGMGEMGNRLYEELSKSKKVEVLYAIDANAESIYSDLNIVSMEDGLEEVDAIVVTAIFDFENISSSLEERINCPIVSLEDVVFEV